MQRRELLIGGGSFAAATLAGCTSMGNPDNESDADSSRTIAVSGQGSSVDEPDLARFRAGIQTTGTSTETIRDELAAREADLRSALIEAGIEQDDITSDRFHVREIRRPSEPHPEPTPDDEEGEANPAPVYEGVHVLRVVVRDVDTIGNILDIAIDAGADHVGSVRFSLTEETQATLRDEAIAIALENAESEAEYIAEELGVEIVAIKHVDSSSGGAPIVRHQVEFADDASSASTEIHPDDVEVTAHVHVVVEFR